MSTVFAALGLASATSPSPAPRELSVEDHDRAAAAAHFALASTLYEQGDLPGALRGYQRAYRWDPTQHAVLDQIVPLAASLERPDVAVRYALVQAEQGSASPEMLRRLALYAAQQQDWPLAARLYRSWLETPSDPANDFQRTLVQIELGRLQHLAGDSSAASQTFKLAQRAIFDDPESDLARRLMAAMGGSFSTTLELMGRCHLEAGESALAAQAFGSLAQDLTYEKQAHYWLARLSVEHAQPLEALEFLHSYFKSPGDPLGDAPYETLRRVFVAINELDRLEGELNRLRDEHPNSCHALLALARCHWSVGASAEARQLCEQLLEGASEESKMQLTLDAFQAAGRWLVQDLVGQNAPNRLLPLLEQLAETDPTLSLFEEDLREALADKDFASQALMRLKLVADDANATPTRRLVASRVSLLDSDYQLADRLLRQAAPDLGEQAAELTLQTAVDLLLADQFSETIDLIRWAMVEQVVPDTEPAAWFYLATALSLDDQTESALEAARRAAELDPTSAQFAARPAWILYQADRQQEAIEAHQQVIADFADDYSPATRKTLRDSQMTLAYLLEEQDPERSCELIEQVLDEFPDDTGAMNDLGFQWAERGIRLRRSLRMIQQAVASDPSSAAYLDSLGWVLFKLGMHEQALASLEQAVAIESQHGAEPDPEILDHLGDVLLALGRKDQARKAWTRAVEQAAKGADATERQSQIREKIASLGATDLIESGK